MREDAVSKLVGILLKASIAIIEIDGLQLTHCQLWHQYCKVYQQLNLKNSKKIKAAKIFTHKFWRDKTVVGPAVQNIKWGVKLWR